jgi:hypothetical protein
MLKKILTTILFLFTIHGFSQGEATKWFFGTNAGLDFSSGSPVVISGSLTTSEGCSSVSNASGNLLFYTNGVSVWDRTHTVMNNGSGLTGDISSTQSALIVPNPASNSQYYIFTTAADGGANGFRYSIVDMTLNSGNGDVTTAKNVLLTDTVTEKIAAIRDPSGDSFWIVIHKWGSNAFYSYHLTPAGLSAPVISNAGMVHTTSVIQNTYGQMKFNMCGDKLAVAIGYQNAVEIFDFNSTTGVVSNPLTLTMGDHVYGVEFSKNSMFLYVTCYDATAKLSQYNLSLATAPLIMASKTPLSVTDDLYGMQIGPDGKIYVARSFGTPFLGLIDSPDTPGSSCNYSDFGLDLDPGFNGVNAALSLPGFMQSYLKIGVTCSVGFNDNEPSFVGTVFPNPSSDYFTIIFNDSSPAEISISDITGRRISQEKINSDTYIFGQEFSAGVYFVSVTQQTRKKVMKVIKN